MDTGVTCTHEMGLHAPSYCMPRGSSVSVAIGFQNCPEFWIAAMSRHTQWLTEANHFSLACLRARNRARAASTVASVYLLPFETPDLLPETASRTTYYLVLATMQHHPYACYVSYLMTRFCCTSCERLNITEYLPAAAADASAIAASVVAPPLSRLTSTPRSRGITMSTHSTSTGHTCIDVQES